MLLYQLEKSGNLMWFGIWSPCMNVVTLHIVSAIADVANTVVKYYIAVYLVV